MKYRRCSNHRKERQPNLWGEWGLYKDLKAHHPLRALRPSLDIMLSSHRVQFHLARSLARSKHGCDLDTARPIDLSSVMSVALVRCLN